MIAVFCLISTYCLAQSQNKLPAVDIIPQEPITAAFSRYRDNAIDLSTGVPKDKHTDLYLKNG